jgi:N-glycosylase/DNA lyase
MFSKKREIWDGRNALIVSDLGDYSLTDTLECGQAFRYELITSENGYVEYMTVVGDELITVGQRAAGELIFYDLSDEAFEESVVRYFSLDTDYRRIRADIVSRTDSAWLKQAAESAKGVAILKQDEWEALFSFIVSQNNNIPRIRKIIRKLSAEYGENLAIKKSLPLCPTGLCGGAPDESVCRECGICYSFPSAEAVAAEPEKMSEAKVGFRYKYLLNSAERVVSGETDLTKIENADSFDIVCEELKKILGVGDKVASCVALFGMARLEAFPIDVWMKRAIDLYFDGKLDPKTLGEYAGVAQQYIFHYIRNLEEK